MRFNTFILASALVMAVITPATASEMKPMPPVDVEKIQEMSQSLQLMHQRHMFETQEMNNRHMKEAHNQSMRHMQESQMMHQQMRTQR